jgi:tetratricopeptide (TPR) repeat protein
LPDLKTLPTPPAKKKSRAKRVAERAAPRCLDYIFHSCWSSPEGTESAASTKAGRELDKNYRAAESRFREALEQRPSHPEATFKLAASLEKLGEFDEARDAYETYLKLEAKSPLAAQAKAALQRLQKQKQQ